MINILFFSIFFQVTNADTSVADTTVMETSVITEELSADTVKDKKRNNLFTGIATGFIHVYQIVISPRQGDVCNFNPSCSHFACEAIEKEGVVKGILMTADRLERCNYSAWQYKDKYYKTKFDTTRGNKLYDPVE
ncbi:MAG: membrane protein insertion efficiency factor YidD [bacterium]|nr:membrane protein insertion efficiency factor YidD [bacterium]